MQIDFDWTCEFCGEPVGGVYRGPFDHEAILRWVQSEHDRISPDCPYKFRFIQLFPASGKKFEGSDEKGPL